MLAIPAPQAEVAALIAGLLFAGKWGCLLPSSTLILMCGPRSDEELDEYLPQVLIGALESPVIEVVDYDPDWARRFSP